MRSEVINADITTLNVDAIVNAANSSLLGGGGVDGAIHRAAGPELRKYCATLNGCKPGFAKISPGFKLHAKWVIHAVGPVWNGGLHGEAALLASCYKQSLLLAAENGVRTIAFPCISTGAYGFPFEPAAEIAENEVNAFLQTNHEPEKVLFVVFGHEQFAIFKKIHDRLTGTAKKS
jgi:O-acetyl-ADP-ribose deacetylase